MNTVFANHTELLNLMAIENGLPKALLDQLDPACNRKEDTEHFLALMDVIDELDVVGDETLYVNIADRALCMKLFPASNPNVFAAYTNVNGKHFLLMNDDFLLPHMAHELQHFIDSVTGRLAFHHEQGKVEWDGELYDMVDYNSGDIKLEEYVNLPWERTAHETEIKYMYDEVRKEQITAALNAH